MDKQEGLEEEYRYRRRIYEEQKDELFQQRNKAISTIDEVQDRSFHFLKNVVSDNGILKRGFQQSESMKDGIFESIRLRSMDLSRKIEELDESYYRSLQKLKEK